MRLVVTAFVALLLWGYTSFTAGDAGIPKWIPAVCLLIVGIVIQGGLCTLGELIL